MTRSILILEIREKKYIAWFELIVNVATIVFGIVIATYVLCNFETVLSNLYNTENLLAIGRRYLVYYLLLVGVYSLVSYVVYSLRYSKMRKSMKAYYGNLKKLARIYEKEQ